MRRFRYQTSDLKCFIKIYRGSIKVLALCPKVSSVILHELVETCITHTWLVVFRNKAALYTQSAIHILTCATTVTIKDAPFSFVGKNDIFPN